VSLCVGGKGLGHVDWADQGEVASGGSTALRAVSTSGREVEIVRVPSPRRMSLRSSREPTPFCGSEQLISMLCRPRLRLWSSSAMPAISSTPGWLGLGLGLGLGLANPNPNPNPNPKPNQCHGERATQRDPGDVRARQLRHGRQRHLQLRHGRLLWHLMRHRRPGYGQD